MNEKIELTKEAIGQAVMDWQEEGKDKNRCAILIMAEDDDKEGVTSSVACNVGKESNLVSMFAHATEKKESGLHEIVMKSAIYGMAKSGLKCIELIDEILGGDKHEDEAEEQQEKPEDGAKGGEV